MFNFKNPKPTVFCIHCNKMVGYDTDVAKVNLTIRGVNFSYGEKIAFCEECGNEVYVAAYNDMNVDAREKAYKNELERRKVTQEIYGVSKEVKKENEKLLKKLLTILSIHDIIKSQSREERAPIALSIGIVCN